MCSMETVLALIKIINPIEWIKEIHKMSVFIRIVLLLVCISAIFIPDSIKGINVHIARVIALCLVPITTVSIIGGFFQNIYDNKKQKELQKIEAEEQERKRTQKELKEKEESKKLLNSYFKQFDLCDRSEKKILEQFYCVQKTSIDISDTEVEYVRVMNSKGINFVSARSHFLRGLAYTTPEGLAIINKYYDLQKEKFFEFLKTLKGRQKTLLYEFNYDNELYPEKGFRTTAFKLNANFKENGFNDIYWDFEKDCLVISELYGVYIEEFLAKQDDNS